MNERKDRIAHAFDANANSYDAAADVQWTVARNLAAFIAHQELKPDSRVLEIGCGTGFLSDRLKTIFPQGQLVLTDIAQSMLDRCRQRVGDGPTFMVMDGETPEGLTGPFDVIAASLTVQWFVDLKGGIERLSSLLAPGGRFMFATLGQDTFTEWRQAHERFSLDCGTPQYPKVEDFPWPEGFSHSLEEERISQPYVNGVEFVHSLKTLGASEPAPGHRPLTAGAFRKLLNSLDRKFTVTYHVLYGEIIRP